MAASSRGFSTPFCLKPRRFDSSPLHHHHRGFEFRKSRNRRRFLDFRCCSDSVVPIRRTTGSGKSAEKKAEEWRFDPKKSPHRVRIQATPALPFGSTQSQFVSKQEKFYPRCTPRNSGPQSRDTPPKRDTGIANEKDWGIDLLNENDNESGTNEDGSTWYRESGEDLGENGYRCRWTRMGGQSHDGSSEWKEMWWEKSDWTGYKELVLQGLHVGGLGLQARGWSAGLELVLLVLHGLQVCSICGLNMGFISGCLVT